MIELNEVSFSYENSLVLNSCSAVFKPGVLYGIVGKNGCGKTTLIRLLCGLLRPSRGKVFLEGTDYEAYSRKCLAQKISLLPQIRFLPAVSVMDLVTYGRFPHLGLSRRLSDSDRQAVFLALKQAGAQSIAHREVCTLSGGERQRACLALLLAQDTPYVLLDEPTTYLDIAYRFSLAEQLKTLRNEGKCVITVLHDLSLALNVCDRILILDGGTVCAEGTAEEIVSCGILQKVFSVRCIPVVAEGKEEYIFRPLDESLQKGIST